MNVLFWPIPSPNSPPTPNGSVLRLRLDEVLGYLFDDWIPWMTPLHSLGLFRWMRQFMRPRTLDNRQHWVLDANLRTAERNWKRVFSNSLGIVGTRHFLAQDGYRWIAPVSAFFGPHPRRVPVSLGPWPVAAYAPGRLVTIRPPNSRGQLTPDYLAIRRRRPGEADFAVVEAKGTEDAIGGENRPCPLAWYRQARCISLAHDGDPFEPARHIVVATRVNPNAVRDRSRRLEVHAWNAAEEVPPAPAGAAVEVAAAHLFGLCMNLDLNENARMLAVAAQTRAATIKNAERPPWNADELSNLRQSADEELRRIMGAEITRGSVSTGRRTYIFLPELLMVELHAATMTLLRDLQSFDDTAAEQALEIADDRLDRVQNTAPNKGSGTLLASGVRIWHSES